MKFQFLHWNTSTCPLQSEDSGAIPVPHYFMLHTMSLGWIILGKNLHKKKGSNCLYIYFLSFKELGSCRDKRHVEKVQICMLGPEKWPFFIISPTITISIWISKGCNISCFTEAAWHKKKTKTAFYQDAGLPFHEQFFLPKGRSGNEKVEIGWEKKQCLITTGCIWKACF